MATTGHIGDAGGFSGGSNSDCLGMRIDWSYTQDTANNKTTLEATLKIKRVKSGATTWKSSAPYTLTIDGTKKSGTVSFDLTSVSVGGYITIASASKTWTHNSDGSISAKTISATFDLSGTSAGKGSISGSVTPSKIARYTSITTHKANSHTDYQITIGWATADAVKKVEYQLGSNSWANVSISGTPKSGSYTIGNLKPGTTYSIKTRVTRSDSGLKTTSGTLRVTTTAAPSLKSTPSVIIGNSVTIGITNPHGRSCSVKFTVAGLTLSGTTSRTTVTFNTGSFNETQKATIYNSIPNSKSGTYTCLMTSTINGTTYTAANKSGTFTVKESECLPTLIANFTAKDNNAKIKALTGSGTVNSGETLKVVKNYSNVVITIPTNMTSTKYGATIKQIRIYGTGIDQTYNYNNNNTFDVNAGNSAFSGSINVTAKDSRGLWSSAKTINFTVLNYTPCKLQTLEATRNKVETTNKINLRIKGTYNQLNFGVKTNSIIDIKLRKKPRTEANYTEDWYSFKDNVTNITSSSFSYDDVLTCADWFLEQGIEYDLKVRVEDELEGSELAVVVDTGSLLMTALKGKGVCFGGIYEDGTAFPFQVKSNARFDGELEADGEYYTTGEVHCRPLPAGTDGRDYWNKLPNGWYWYQNTNAVANLPAAHGFIEKRGYVQNQNSTIGSDFTVTFYKQSHGPIWRKSGNVDKVSDWVLFSPSQVGDVIITSTNTNPSATHGGTWKLIDKQFASWATNDVNTILAINSTNTTRIDTAILLRQDHTITMKFDIVTKVTLNDSTHDMFTIKQAALGCNSEDFYYTRHGVAVSDGGNAMAMITLTSAGVFSVRDVVTKAANGSIAAGQTINFTFNWTLPMSRMADSACDRFYWKRTA